MEVPVGVQESAPNANQSEKEGVNYPFLEKLSVDHSQLTKALKQKIPGWKEKVNALSEIHGLGNKILEIMDYVSMQNENDYFGNVAQEVQTILNGNSGDKIVFVSWLTGKSGGYVFENIRGLLPEEQQPQMEIVSSCDLNIWQHQDECKSKKVHYFICDDSANSGSQLTDLLKPFKTFAKKVPQKRFFDRSKNTNLHIRMMRMADPAREVVDNFENVIKGTHVYVDNNSPRIPQMVDALLELNIDPEVLNEQAQRAIIFDHKNEAGAIAGFFYHKIQDNLPPVLLKGRHSDKVGFQLLSKEDIPQIYK